MPDTRFFTKYGSKIAVALVLTLGSGLVDIIGYVGVFHLFTAHVTGTTVHLGQSLVLDRHTDVLSATAVLVSFFFASVLGRAMIEAASRRRFHRIASITLGIETIMLAIVAHAAVTPGSTRTLFVSARSPYLYLALLSGAMGLQTATLTGIGPLTVHTTFVTGMVNKLAQLVAHISFRSYDMLRGRSRTLQAYADQSVEAKQAGFIFSIWICYIAGAALGSWSYLSWGIRSLLIAVGALLVGIVTDLFRPLSVQEERDQSER
jgi:uncharacterized membrane protein YoaK (UPF0700 family)